MTVMTRAHLCPSYDKAERMTAIETSRLGKTPSPGDPADVVPNSDQN